MRPIGFVSPARRFERSLVVGLIVGVGAMAIATVLVVCAKNSPAAHAMLSIAAWVLGWGFCAGFGLALTWPDFAPPEPRDDGDAEAGVPAGLIPPVPTLSARNVAEAHARNA